MTKNKLTGWGRVTFFRSTVYARGFCVLLVFGHQLQDPPPPDHFGKIFLLLVMLPVEELHGWTHLS